MAGAISFLYGLALGVSLGVIASGVLAAASSGSRRRTVLSTRQRPPARASHQKRIREGIATR